MTVASRAYRLLPGLLSVLLLQTAVAQAQTVHDAKPSVAPAKPTAAPPRMSKADVTRPSRPAANAKPAEHAQTAEPAKPAQAGKSAAAPAGEHVDGAETTRVAQRVVTPGRKGLKSAERAVAALGAALSARGAALNARRDRVARQEAEAPPPAPAPVRRPAPRRRVAPPAPPAPAPPRYEVPWPSRIVELHWPKPADQRSVSWPSDRLAPIELRWDLKALQSDLSEPTATVGR